MCLLLAGCGQQIVTQPPPEPALPGFVTQKSKPLPPLPERAVSLPELVEEYANLRRLYLSEAGRGDACRRFAVKLARGADG